MKTSFSVTPESAELIANIARSAGNWDKIADKCVKRVAENCAKDVKKRIVDQAFPNVRLTDAWLKRKIKQGLDTRTLMATRQYYESIEARKVEPGVWGVVCNDLDQRDRLEKGTKRGMPPRPHWAPVLAEYQMNFARIFAAEVVQELFGGKR